VGDAMGDTFLKLLFINTLEVLKVEPGEVGTKRPVSVGNHKFYPI
jgi:hypothetical protein